MREKKKKRFFTTWRKIKILLLLGFIAFIVIGLDQRLIVRRYRVDVPGVEMQGRLVLITDLHDCVYGQNQQELIDAVCAQQPDAVLLGGDIFGDKTENKNTEMFLRGIAGKYPCYYVAGNHEHWGGEELYRSMLAFLSDLNITVLSWERTALELDGGRVWLCGADEARNAFDRLKGLHPNDGQFTILLSHWPENFDLYVQAGYDLALSGHAHGGQWRLPFVMNGLYAPGQGFLPAFAGGMYTKDDTTMIVSRGLARESTKVPRFYNRPELVVVDLH